MKKYLITGVAGFVAYHFLEYLNSFQQDDIEVLGIDINIPNSTYCNSFKNLKLNFVAINLLNYKELEIALVSFSPEYIVHLASFSSVAQSWQDPITSFMNNTNIFLNIVEIIRKNNIGCRLLSIGSSEEYGNITEDSLPLKEIMRLNPSSPYAIARVAQEMLSQCYVSSYKLDIILTRSFNHIGTRQRDTFVIPSFIKQILESMKMGQTTINLYTGDVTIVRDFLNVRDVVRAYHLLLEKGITGELYNVCTGRGYTLKEIINMLADLLKINIRTEIDLTKIRPSENRVIIGDNTKIRLHTGWQPTISISETLQELIQYWKNVLNMTE